ncbi:hypothetical protein GPN2_10064 [Streptomyces murinus]
MTPAPALCGIHSAALRLPGVTNHGRAEAAVATRKHRPLGRTREGKRRKNPSGHATTPAGGESGGRPHGRLGGGRSRTGLARSRTIRDFHGVPESLLRQTHAPHLTPNGGRLCSGTWKTTPCLARRPSSTWTRRSLRSPAHSPSASPSTKAG